MIIITGAAGFIGSCLVKKLNSLEKDKLILVDDFSSDDKNKNLAGKYFHNKIDRSQFIEWFRENANKITEVYHIGARTDTTELDNAIFDKLNLNYSKSLWKICTDYEIPFIYASSAATYGLGEFGFEDDHCIVNKLAPLNPYVFLKMLLINGQYVSIDNLLSGLGLSFLMFMALMNFIKVGWPQLYFRL